MRENSSEIIKYIHIARENHKKGNIYQANEIYKKLINQKIYTYELLISYGLFCKEINNLNIAKNLFILSIKKYPSKINSYILLAEILRKENKVNDALKTLYAAKKIEKSNSEIDYNLSISYKTIKSFRKAILSIDSAIKLQPKNQIYQILKADILVEIFKNEEAKKLLVNLKLPNDSLLYFQKEILISKIFINQKKYKLAEGVLLGLRKLFCKERILYLNLSDLYFKNKELEKGILILKEGIKNFPKFIPLRFNLAIMYRNLGLIELSIKTHLEILLDDQLNSNSYYELSTMYNFSNHNEQLKTLLNIEIGNLSPMEKIYFCYSKSNAYHNNKDYKKSAYFLKIANDEKLKIQPSDLKKKLNTGEYFRNLKIDQNLNLEKVKDSNQYLFIVGMPRCGSTLLESILSLNPEVKDLGEVTFLEESLKKSDDLLEVRKLYKEKVMLVTSKQKKFTDKNLFNFLYCPIIYKFFPNAKIIHCIRNPLDNILSIYRTNFLNQSFSSSLNDISDLYLYHLKLMKEYKSKFGSIIYSYDHEKVVRNPRETIQDLINWLDWEWNEKYLSPQKSKRSVYTASSAQVRKKINANSSGCWKKYEDLLEPISEQLIPYVQLN
ncbi:MAG: sulfotransferase [Prochlorococcus marinus XMU1422]|nr:sulfotransferase [Prochlorococcus marinus XMU1421]MBO7013575.1 sulfotransferase [Prochlorococcus marinus XMU1422]MCR8542484.1 sulfotransferase [Prochlorococcus marinus XMU1423]